MTDPGQYQEPEFSSDMPSIFLRTASGGVADLKLTQSSGDNESSVGTPKFSSVGENPSS